MVARLKASFEHRWAWLTLVVGVLSGLVADVQSMLPGAVAYVGQVIDAVRMLVEQVAAWAAVFYLTFANLVREALGKIKGGPR